MVRRARQDSRRAPPRLFDFFTPRDSQHRGRRGLDYFISADQLADSGLRNSVDHYYRLGHKANQLWQPNYDRLHVQLHKELEEASEVCGVGWLKTFCLITLRLLVPAFVNGWLYFAMLSIALFTIPVMLFTPKSIVFSVLIWNLWEQAKVQDACVVGVLMVTITFTLVFFGQYFASKAKIRESLT